MIIGYYGAQAYAYAPVVGGKRITMCILTTLYLSFDAQASDCNANLGHLLIATDDNLMSY